MHRLTCSKDTLIPGEATPCSWASTSAKPSSTRGAPWARGQDTAQGLCNDPAGFRHPLSWLRSWGAQPVHACLEATGTYGEALAAFLSEQGHTVSLINPAGYPCLHG
jgi:hypothetical protein